MALPEPSRIVRPSGRVPISVTRRFCLGAHRLLWLLCLFPLTCQSKSTIGTFVCPVPRGTGGGTSAAAGGAAGDSGALASAGTTPTGPTLALPWSTGFENGFCDFDAAGFCLPNDAAGGAHYEVVTEPVHSGKYAAAFTVDSANEGQSRCVVQGNLPDAAYYGAWYYIPERSTNEGLWNLFHFQGDSSVERGHLWDVSLLNTASGDLRLEIFSYLTPLPDQSSHPIIPIGEWFHIEMYLKRARDKTGEVIVYQDGAKVFELAAVVTNNSSTYSQWYVGNLANALTPNESTIYVDDVTVSLTRQGP